MLTPTPEKPYFQALPSKQGFALIISLTLMAFVLVLMLGLAAFIRVESSSLSTQSSLIKARQNARLAALVALGELQMSMGQDTRVSARAEILSDLNPDNPDNGTAPFNADEVARFWTGTWDSKNWNPGAPADRQGRFKTWLVSLPEIDQLDITSVAEGALPFNPTNDSDSAVVASVQAIPYDGNTPERTEVRVPLQNIDTSGAMGWWISDEGVKANIGMVDPTLGEMQSGVINDIPRYLFPQRNNLTATQWFEDTDFNEDTLVAKLLKSPDVSSSAQLILEGAPLSDEASATLANTSMMNDFTFYSYGVLSNNRHGGLRKDLSLAFWRNPGEMILFEPDTPMENEAFENDFRRRRIFNYQDYPQDEQTIRSPSSADRNFFAPRWEVLQDFHNSFQKIVNPETADAWVPPLTGADGNHYLHIYRTSEGSGSTINFEYATLDHLHVYAPDDRDAEIVTVKNEIATKVEPTTSPISPILLRMNIQFELATIEKLDSSGNPKVDDEGNQIYQPEMRLRPTVTLWNPYNVAISYEALDGSLVDGGFLQLNTQTGGKIYINFDIDDKKFSLVRTAGRNGLTASNNIIEMEFNPVFPALNYLAPGEIRVLSVASTTDADDANMSNELELSSVFPPDEAFLTLTKALAGIEKMQGDTLEITTEITDTGGGLRPTLYPGTDVNSNYTHRFRIAMAEQFGPEETSLTVDGVNSVILGSLELQLQPGSAESNPDYRPRQFANFNVRSIMPKGGFTEAYAGQVPNYWIGFLPGPAEVDYQKVGVTTDDGTLQRGFWGASAGSDGENFIALFDVPRRPPESIGQYQHAHLSNLYPHMPTYPLGNSVADPHVARPYAIDNSNNRTFMDISWLLNDTLWDGYFLSTIDPYDIDNLSPSRLAPLRERFVELDDTVDYDPKSASDYREVAANLLLRGAFNVNSTSVEAWAAFLAGLEGDGIKFIAPELATLGTTAGLEHSFHRLSMPTGDRNAPWRGGPLDFDRDAIRTLAEKMVEEVKKRGPFLSLSDFINRRLTNDERGLKGAIQAAIDNTPSTNVLPDNNGTISLSDSPVPGNLDGNPLDFAPGDLSQADVLAQIGPTLSARSDTFIIRSYGRVTDPILNNVTSEAWCEMLVQRIPEDPSEDIIGRPFRVVRFRYLNADEI